METETSSMHPLNYKQNGFKLPFNKAHHSYIETVCAGNSNDAYLFVYYQYTYHNTCTKNKIIQYLGFQFFDYCWCTILDLLQNLRVSGTKKWV